MGDRPAHVSAASKLDVPTLAHTRAPQPRRFAGRVCAWNLLR